MEYKSREQILGVVSTVANWLQPQPMTKREKLEHWAAVLESESGRRFRTLFEIEHAPPAERCLIRADDSPLSVALADKKLRAEGLAGDTVGDAMRFFEVSETELHNMLCYCLYGETMSSEVAAARVRQVASRA